MIFAGAILDELDEQEQGYHEVILTRGEKILARNSSILSTLAFCSFASLLKNFSRLFYYVGLGLRRDLRWPNFPFFSSSSHDWGTVM